MADGSGEFGGSLKVSELSLLTALDANHGSSHGLAMEVLFAKQFRSFAKFELWQFLRPCERESLQQPGAA